ncbi:autophagy-related protein 9A-like [Argiope bruennichi]|uniref:autophagy-related protein 9A-like n=1 Tax=Argiope bruennichi TaxID=94029 RepID=UPI0024944C6A|nr:autophagy-related protein 9A-like [Argiope bruennichi]
MSDLLYNMNSLQTNYQALVSDDTDGPHDSVVFQVSSDDSCPRWNHVDDLDAFFQRIYHYHQSGGYLCIMTKCVIRVLFFALIGFGFVYCSDCIYFNFDLPSSPFYNTTITSFSQLFIPISVCAATQFNSTSWFCVTILSMVLIYRLYKLIDTGCKYRDIKVFYESVMKISKYDLPNVTWHEVVSRLREVQHEQQICVNNTDLNELDISHRILRTTNYMVAMVNKNILPLKISTRFFGEWYYFSSQLQTTLVFLLFTSTYLSPFKAPGKLKEEFKKREERAKCAAQLTRTFRIVGLLCVFMIPLFFFWSILSFLVNYSGYVRLEPGFFSVRRWSRYARLYLRHFNEMDHELDKRLGRASKPAKDYMRSFSTPLVVVINKFIVKLLGFSVAFVAFWGIFKEELFTIPNVLVVLSIGGILFSGLSACVPDENEVLCPYELMQKILADIHYVPDHFKTMAHTTKVRDEFGHLFPYRFVTLLDELISPLITPMLLMFVLPNHTLEIVDFLRNFTVHADGVGDVCSFALMDVLKHGNPRWLGDGLTKAGLQEQAEDGKTELSVLHFALMNPNWEPPQASNAFIQNFREQVNTAKDQYPGLDSNPFYNSLNSVSTMGSKYASLANSIHQSKHQSFPRPGSSSLSSGLRTDRIVMTGLSQAEGPPYLAQNGIWTSTADLDMESSLRQAGLNAIEARAADMSLSALFLHEVHDRHMGSIRSQGGDIQQSQSESQRRQEGEELPLLRIG